MFKNEDFKVDKNSEAYKLAKPTAANLEGFQSDQEDEIKKEENQKPKDPRKEAKAQKKKEIEQKVSKMMGEDVE